MLLNFIIFLLKYNLTPTLVSQFQNFGGYHLRTFQLVVDGFIRLIWVVKLTSYVLRISVTVVQYVRATNDPIFCRTCSSFQKLVLTSKGVVNCISNMIYQADSCLEKFYSDSVCSTYFHDDYHDYSIDLQIHIFRHF